MTCVASLLTGQCVRCSVSSNQVVTLTHHTYFDDLCNQLTAAVAEQGLIHPWTP